MHIIRAYILFIRLIWGFRKKGSAPNNAAGNNGSGSIRIRVDWFNPQLENQFDMRYVQSVADGNLSSQELTIPAGSGERFA